MGAGVITFSDLVHFFLAPTMLTAILLWGVNEVFYGLGNPMPHTPETLAV